MPSAIHLHKNQQTRIIRQLVEEYPLRLRVNGRDLATLVCSPHQLHHLLAGFCFQQGFIATLEDLFCLGICQEKALAELRLRHSPRLEVPTLTTGCSGGVSYLSASDSFVRRRSVQYRRATVFSLMSQLSTRAERYRSHGGIHSAAVGDEDGLLLFAEDIGRHNTLDRLTGEALFENIDLKDTLLMSSGRVSSEMVIKAVRLGIGLIASRTSPTEQAVQLCEKAGITLIGYLRGRSCEIYSHPQQLDPATPKQQKIAGISGVILAGGESLRMGSDKSLLPFAGARFIDHVYARLAELFDEVLIVTNTPELYPELPCRKVRDVYPLQGALAGIHSGLQHAGCERAFVVGCDMPFLSAELVRLICTRATLGDLILPIGSSGHEPLHALYSKSCLPIMEQVLDAGQRRIQRIFRQLRVVEIPAEELQQVDPQEQSFRNINTPEEYFQLRGNRTAAKLAGVAKSPPSGVAAVFQDLDIPDVCLRP